MLAHFDVQSRFLSDCTRAVDMCSVVSFTVFGMHSRKRRAQALGRATPLVGAVVVSAAYDLAKVHLHLVASRNTCARIPALLCFRSCIRAFCCVALRSARDVRPRAVRTVWRR